MPGSTYRTNLVIGVDTSEISAAFEKVKAEAAATAAIAASPANLAAAATNASSSTDALLRQQQLLAGVGGAGAASQLEAIVGALNSHAALVAGSEKASEQIGLARQTAVAESLKAVGPEAAQYAEDLATTAIALKQQNASVQAILAGSAEYLEAETTTAIALAQQKALFEAELAASEEFTAAKVATTISLAQQKALYDAELAGSQEYIDAKVLDAIALKTQAAQLDEELAINTEYIAAIARATAAANARAEAEGRNVAPVAANSEVASTGGTGLFSSGISGLAKFALGAGAFIGVSVAVRDILRETTALQSQFAILQTQMEQTDTAGQFPGLRDGLFQIGRETGIATSELAKLAIQVHGTFQGQPGRNEPQFILQQVKSAAEINKVFGLSFGEIGNSVQALSFTFNKSFQDIGDRAAGLQARFGVTAKELINSVSQIAPVAHDLGLSFEQVTAVTAAAERETGRTGVSVTEALGRVLPNISQHTQDILAVYQGNTALASSYQKMVDNLASGKTGQVLLQLIEDWNKLSQAQRNALLVGLGGGRQAPQLAAVFGDPQLLKELNQPINDTGKLADQFNKLKGTLGQALSEIKQSLTQLGVALANLGIIQGFEILGGAIKSVIDLATPFVRVIGTVNDALGGWISKITGLVLAFQALRLVARADFIQGLAGRIGIQTIAASKTAAATETATQGTLGLETGAAAGGAATTTAGLTGAAATATTAALGVGLGVVVVNTLASGFNQGVKSQIEKLGQTLPQQGATAANIKKASQGFIPGFGSIGEVAAHGLNVISGGAQPEELLQDEYQKVVGQVFLNQIKAVANLKGFKNPKELLRKLGQARGEINSDDGATNRTLSSIDVTDDESFKELRSVHDKLIKRFGKAFVDGAIKGLQQNKSDFTTALQGGNADQISSTGTDLASSLKAQYESGEISYSTYIASLEGQIKGLQDVVSRSTGGTRKQDLQTLKKLLAQRSKTTSDYLKSQIDYSSQLRDLTGSNTYSDADLQQLETVLANPKFTDPGDRSAVLAQIVSATKAKLQDEVNRLSDNAAKIARATAGEPLPNVAKVELARQYLDLALQNVGQFAQRLDRLAESQGTSTVALETKAVDLANFLGISLSAAMKLILQDMIRRFNQRLNVLRLLQKTAILVFGKKDRELTGLINGLKGQIADATKALGELNKAADITLPDIGNVQLDTSSLEGQQNKDDLAKRIEIAKANYLEALAALDPVAAAQAAVHTADVTIANAKDEAEWWDAQAQRVRAEQQLDAAILNRAKLVEELYQAKTSDPVKQAQSALKIAVGELLNAHGPDQIIQAQIDIANAQKQLQDAMTAIIVSQINLVQAMAQAAGDTVGAAQDAVAALQAQLSAAIAADAGAAAINSLKAQIITAQAGVRDAILQEKESTIDFNLQVQKISTAQAISEYQALLSQADILGLTEAQRRDLILKIQNLKHTLNQDLQFDLPTDLRLPTLYEARRLSQTGGNYQDNRVTTITLNSTDPASTQAAVTQIQDALNAPPLYGSGTRIY